MLKLLKKALEELPDLMKDPEQWTSLDIDCSPKTRRVWTVWNNNKIMLERFGPCGPGEARYRPNPGPSATVIMRGQCEVGIGFSSEARDEAPIISRTLAGGGECFEMPASDTWHYIRPTQETFAITVMGTAWGCGPEFKENFSPLDEETKEDVIFTFSYHLERWPIRIPNI